MKSLLVIAATVLFMNAESCGKKAAETGLPSCLQEMILEYQNRPVQNPPASIYQYSYNGRTVYYVKPPCCDQLSKLYDENCNYLCAPDGGFTGTGDGKCRDFHELKQQEKLIWNDPRAQ